MQDQEQERWLNQLEQEQANLRAALRWAADHQEAALGLRLSVALAQFWHKRGYWTEGRQWLETFLKMSESSQVTPLHAKALYSLGSMIVRTGNCAEAGTIFDRCLQVSCEVEAPYWSAHALAMLGMVAHRQGSYEEGQRFYAASLNLFEAISDQWGIAYALFAQANYAFLAGQVTALDWKASQKSLALFRAAGDTAYEVYVLKNLGIESYYQGRDGDARALLQDSLELSRQVDYVSHTASTLAFLGMVAVAQADMAAAAKHLHESIGILATASHRFAIAEALDAFSVLAFARQEPAQTLCFGGAAAAVRAAIGVRPYPVAQSRLDVVYDAARQQLSTDQAASAWAKGAAMTLDEAVAFALAQPDNSVITAPAKQLQRI